MLDGFSQKTTVSTWQQVLSHGHIVTFRFPVRDSDDKPKIRPCLVLDTYIRDGQKFAVLAYGTTADTNATGATKFTSATASP